MAGETVLTIVGNLTADPELRTISNGAAVASFTIAATPRTYNRQTGQFEDGQALFMRCSAWRDLAEHCARSLTKGMRVIAQGTLRQRSYEAQDGSRRVVIDMTVDEIGPSLRYATAAVARQQTSHGFRDNRQGGYSGGATYGAQPPAQPAQSAPSDPFADANPRDEHDPWADDGAGDDPKPDAAGDPEF